MLALIYAGQVHFALFVVETVTEYIVYNTIIHSRAFIGIPD
jgi:hypothetical protein